MMKFLVDAMLGKLARFLRILGYDTVYATDLRDFYKSNPVPDEKLIDYAENNKRLIITKDFPLHNAYKKKSIYLKGVGTYIYLAQLKKKLTLDFNFEIEKARCSICNSKLKKVKDKYIIKEIVPRDTLSHYDDFYQCVNPQCKKLYWQGSHIEDIKNRMNNMLKTE